MLIPFALIAWASLAVAGGPTGCDSATTLITACTSNSGTAVDVSGRSTTPGRNGADSAPPPGGAAPPEAVVKPQLPPAINCEPTAPICRPYGFTVEMLPDVTAADLASFSPARPSLAGEPGGLGVVGMATNFVSSASPQTLTGTLFDRPVTVSFVPVAYVFDYGDGTVRRSTTGGASWESLGQAQFSATATSHAYDTRGVYRASVSVEYRAWVDFGTGPRPVIGLVTATTGGYTVEVYVVRTALVDRTCAEDPAGPGC